MEIFSRPCHSLTREWISGDLYIFAKLLDSQIFKAKRIREKIGAPAADRDRSVTAANN